MKTSLPDDGVRCNPARRRDPTAPGWPAPGAGRPARAFSSRTLRTVPYSSPGTGSLYDAPPAPRLEQEHDLRRLHEGDPGHVLPAQEAPVGPDAVPVEAEADAAGERHQAEEVDGHQRQPDHVRDRPLHPGVDGRGDRAEDPEGEEPRQLGGPRRRPGDDGGGRDAPVAEVAGETARELDREVEAEAQQAEADDLLLEGGSTPRLPCPRAPAPRRRRGRPRPRLPATGAPGRGRCRPRGASPRGGRSARCGRAGWRATRPRPGWPRGPRAGAGRRSARRRAGPPRAPA